MPHRAEKRTAVCWTSCTPARPRLHCQTPQRPTIRPAQRQGGCPPGARWLSQHPAEPAFPRTQSQGTCTTLLGASPLRRSPLTSLPSHRGLGAEEPLSTTGSPPSMGQGAHSGSEETGPEPRASAHGSGELRVTAAPRTRTASELLLHRCAAKGGQWALAVETASQCQQAGPWGPSQPLSMVPTGACTSPSWRRPNSSRPSRAGHCSCCWRGTSAWPPTRSCSAISSSSSTTWSPPRLSPWCCPCWSSCGPCCPSRGPAGASG